MALTITTVEHPTGARTRVEDGETSRVFKIVGDGVGGTASLSYGGFARRVTRVTSPYEWVINTTTKAVEVVVPAGLASTEAVNVEVFGV